MKEKNYDLKQYVWFAVLIAQCRLYFIIYLVHTRTSAVMNYCMT